MDKILDTKEISHPSPTASTQGLRVQDQLQLDSDWCSQFLQCPDDHDKNVHYLVVCQAKVTVALGSAGTETKIRVPEP